MAIRQIEVSCVAWMDLLGYGSMLKESYFDPFNPLSRKAINRLHRFHKIVSDKAERNFDIIGLNDGIAAFRDLSIRSSSVSFDFLKKSLELFQAVIDAERVDDYPGARMVIATGYRIRGENDVIFPDEIKPLLNKLKRGLIDPMQAVHEASRARPHFGIIPELQANFAFTKAYLVDEGGSKAGFGGANCYIDLNLFNNQLTEWIKFSKVVEWNGMNMSSRFGLFESINTELANKMAFNGILNALEISNILSGSTDSTLKMLASRITKNLRAEK